jgi:hypothetical protein
MDSLEVADILEWRGTGGTVHMMVLEINPIMRTFTAYNFTTQRINNDGWSYDYDQYHSYGYFVRLG